MRVVARILRWRFFKEKRCANISQPTFIGANEFKCVENVLFSIVQRNNFAADYKSLLQKNAVTNDCVFKSIVFSKTMDNKTLLETFNVFVITRAKYRKCDSNNILWTAVHNFYLVLQVFINNAVPNKPTYYTWGL